MSDTQDQNKKSYEPGNTKGNTKPPPTVAKPSAPPGGQKPGSGKPSSGTPSNSPKN